MFKIVSKFLLATLLSLTLSYLTTYLVAVLCGINLTIDHVTDWYYGKYLTPLLSFCYGYVIAYRLLNTKENT